MYDKAQSSNFGHVAHAEIKGRLKVAETMYE